MDRLQNEQDYMKLVLQVALFWELFFLSTFLVQAMTYLALKDIESNATPRGLSILGRLKPALPALLLSGLVVGLAVLVGLRAFVIPGVLLFALYLYVPDLLAREPGSSLLLALKRSWRFASENMAGVAGIVVAFALLVITSFLLDQALQNVAEPEGALAWAFKVVDVGFSLVTGMWLHAWVASFFIERTRERSL